MDQSKFQIGLSFRSIFCLAHPCELNGLTHHQTKQTASRRFEFELNQIELKVMNVCELLPKVVVCQQLMLQFLVGYALPEDMNV